MFDQASFSEFPVQFIDQGSSWQAVWYCELRTKYSHARVGAYAYGCNRDLIKRKQIIEAKVELVSPKSSQSIFDTWILPQYRGIPW